MVLSEGLQAKSEQVHVRVNKVLLERHHTHALHTVCGCSCARQQSGVVTTEIIRPTKPCSLQKFAYLCFKPLSSGGVLKCNNKKHIDLVY